MTRHLVVIGAQRSGTTYLYRVLDEHPDIAMARPARPEPKFFLNEEHCRRGLPWYEATYFPDAGAAAVHGEKSTSYIESAAAATRARGMIPDARILALLRDPVARAVSNWCFSAGGGLEERPLEQALRENLEGPRPWDPERTSVSPFAYLERGRYIDQLGPWFDCFGDQVSIHFAEEVIHDPAAVAAVYAAVGVDPSYRARSIGAVVNATTGATPHLTPGLQDTLRAYFRASDERLRQHVGRALPWDA